MTSKKNPATGDRGRVLNAKAFGEACVQNLTQTAPDLQPELLARDRIARQFGIGRHHARVVVELAGIGGVA